MRDAFDSQHDFGEIAHGGVRHSRREQLREAAFYFIQLWDFGLAEAEKLSVAAADSGQELLFLRRGGEMD